MITVTLNFGLIGEIFVDSVVGMNGVASRMEGGVGDGRDSSVLKSLHAFFDLGGNNRNVERGALFRGVEALQAVVVDKMIGGKIVPSRGNASKNRVELRTVIKVALVLEDFFNVFNGFGEFFEAVGEFFLGAVGTLERTDDVFILNLEMKSAKLLVAAIEGVFTGRRTRISD